MSHHELDARRLLCPLPVIRAQDKAKTLNRGDTLTVICTDPGALLDIPAWCKINGHKVINASTVDKEVIITLEVNGLGT